MTRRLAAACAVLALAPTAALAAAPPGSWAQPQIKLVIGQGLFAGTPASFGGDAALTEGALSQALGRLTGGGVVPTDPAASVSMAELDHSLVDALGLGDAAYRFYRAARAVGLDPSPSFGTEVVARLLGLRLNHPAGHDDLELQPQQTATRAEAAYSLAQILRFGRQQQQPAAAATPVDYGTSWPVEQVKAASESFALPALTVWQRLIIGTAFSYVGYPYVWGGTGDGTAGFDCSGFVWRVYKLTAYPDEGDLASVLHGRTTMAMSAEVPRSQRIGVNDLQAGDVLFFGRGSRSKPAQIDHAAIYLGNGWLVQSSREGVALAPFDGWYRSSFAWARRPLGEARLGG